MQMTLVLVVKPRTGQRSRLVEARIKLSFLRGEGTGDKERWFTYRKRKDNDQGDSSQQYTNRSLGTSTDGGGIHSTEQAVLQGLLREEGLCLRMVPMRGW